MIKMTKTEQETKDEQDLLLNIVVELKKRERSEMIRINNNIKYLNRIANKIMSANKNKLKQIDLLLDNLLENGFR